MADPSDPDPYDPYNPFDDEEERRPLPCYPLADDVAVGSLLHPGFLLEDELPNPLYAEAIDSASDEYLVLGNGGWTALREGQVGLLALGNGMVFDYKFLTLRLVDQIELVAPSLLPIREPIALSATPRGDGVALAGVLDWQWEEASAGIEVLSYRGDEAFIEITTQQPVTLEVSAGGHTETIVLEPYPGPMRTPTGGGR